MAKKPTRAQQQFIGEKIRTLRHEGYPQRQAIAVAYSMAGVPARRDPAAPPAKGRVPKSIYFRSGSRYPRYKKPSAKVLAGLKVARVVPQQTRGWLVEFEDGMGVHVHEGETSSGKLTGVYYALKVHDRVRYYEEARPEPPEHLAHAYQYVALTQIVPHESAFHVIQRSGRYFDLTRSDLMADVHASHPALRDVAKRSPAARRDPAYRGTPRSSAARRDPQRSAARRTLAAPPRHPQSLTERQKRGEQPNYGRESLLSASPPLYKAGDVVQARWGQIFEVTGVDYPSWGGLERRPMYSVLDDQGVLHSQPEESLARLAPPSLRKSWPPPSLRKSWRYLERGSRRDPSTARTAEDLARHIAREYQRKDLSPFELREDYGISRPKAHLIWSAAASFKDERALEREVLRVLTAHAAASRDRSGPIRAGDAVQLRFDPGTGGVVEKVRLGHATVATSRGPRQVPLDALRRVRPEHEARTRRGATSQGRKR